MATMLNEMRERVIAAGGFNARLDIEAERVAADVLRFLEEQLALRGVIGVRLGGEMKARRGYPDVVFGLNCRAHAIWVDVNQAEESAECRHMREKMSGGWICHRVGDKTGVLEALSKSRQ